MQLMIVNQSAIDNQPVNQPAIEIALTVITEMENKADYLWPKTQAAQFSPGLFGAG